MPADVAHEIRWPDSPHCMQLVQVGHWVRARLVIRKDLTQETEWFYFPKPTTVETILSLWEAQGGDWEHIFVYRRVGLYIAKRAFWLPDGFCVMWDLSHIDKIAHDQCGVVPLTKEEWRFGHVADEVM